MKTIFLGGVHGVGKSTIIQGIMKTDKNIGHYSFGENVREIAKSTGRIKDVKDLSGLNNENRLIVMKEARQRLKNIISSEIYKILLIDNHFSVYEDKKLVRALDDEELACYSMFVLVDVPTDILHTRILHDNKQRTRESCDREKIAQHRIYERTVAEDFKKRCNIDLIEVENIYLEEAIEMIQKRI